MAVIDEPVQPTINLSREAAREIISAAPQGRSRRFRKRADVLAVQMNRPFVVQTDHGAIGGDAGDWLTMNDPAVDPGSDAWPLSDERRQATYVPAGADDRREILAKLDRDPSWAPLHQFGPDPLEKDRSNPLNRIALALEELVAGDRRRLELIEESNALHREVASRGDVDSTLYQQIGRAMLAAVAEQPRPDDVETPPVDLEAEEELVAAGRRAAAGSERRF